MKFNASLAALITRVSFAAISRATRRAASSRSARGTTSCTEPNWCSVAASTVAAVKNSRRIMCCGTSRDRWVAAPSAPRSTSGRPNVASWEATITSAFPTSPIPPPTQNPLTAATTGTSHSYTALNAAKQPRLASISAVKPVVFCISLMSTPALNPRPSARRITAWVARSRPAAVMVSARSNQPRDGMALTGG